jgi:hypothetical protein
MTDLNRDEDVLADEEPIFPAVFAALAVLVVVVCMCIVAYIYIFPTVKGA